MTHNAAPVRVPTGHRRWSAPCACNWDYKGLGGKQDAETAARVHNAVCNALDAVALLACHCWREVGDGGVEFLDRCPRCTVLDELKGIAA